jgi:hypothetical protein
MGRNPPFGHSARTLGGRPRSQAYYALPIDDFADDGEERRGAGVRQRADEQMADFG